MPGKLLCFLSAVDRLVRFTVSRMARFMGILRIFGIPRWPRPRRPYTKTLLVNGENIVSLFQVVDQILFLFLFVREREEEPSKYRLVQLNDGFIIVIFLKCSSRLAFTHNDRFEIHLRRKTKTRLAEP